MDAPIEPDVLIPTTGDGVNGVSGANVGTSDEMLNGGTMMEVPYDSNPFIPISVYPPGTEGLPFEGFLLEPWIIVPAPAVSNPVFPVGEMAADSTPIPVIPADPASAVVLG